MTTGMTIVGIFLLVCFAYLAGYRDGEKEERRRTSLSTVLSPRIKR